jgi:phosphonopyruvate decarboxylase
MIKAIDLLKFFIKNNIFFFSGVPDSVLKFFLKELKSNRVKNIISANEGSAIGISIGQYLKTKKLNVTYMQNSGLGNAINPLISIADKNVYSIPLILLIGWRGRPGEKDEPQHITQGLNTKNFLKNLNIKFIELRDKKDFVKAKKLITYAKKNLKSVAFLISKNILEGSKEKKVNVELKINRYEFLEKFLYQIKTKDLIVSNTGYTSRELDTILKKRKRFNQKVIYMVGGMGHSSSVSLGYSIENKNKVYCIDGDGSMLMHLGALATCAQIGKKNFKYILLNNYCHESVGSQPTISKKINFEFLSKSLKFKNYIKITNINELEKKLTSFLDKEGPNFLEVVINTGTLKKLSRPSNLKRLIKKI